MGAIVRFCPSVEWVLFPAVERMRLFLRASLVSLTSLDDSRGSHRMYCPRWRKGVHNKTASRSSGMART